jgi:DNA-binding XRE family transcriptional regulator
MVDFIEKGGVRFAIIPEVEFRRLTEAEEDLADLRAFDAAKRKDQELVPIEVADRMIAGESPLRVWREYRGLTQQQLAAAAGISKPYISQIEGEARTPSIDVIKRLAAALAVDVDDLL